MREALEKDYGIRIASAKQVIQAILAPAELADLLEIKPKSALLFIERISHSQGRIPVEFLRIYYRADRYYLFNELHEQSLKGSKWMDILCLGELLIDMIPAEIGWGMTDFRSSILNLVGHPQV